ncbi:MAG TPA: hypothetical protein VJ596_04730, partial [Gemmatimonadaceae bacterium]|nr:hypothetical protein [Gemmatimonadaceae bacterium]
DAHATRLLHRRRSGAASDTPSPVGRAVDGCPYLVVGNWGLSPAQRSALEREWARLHPRHTPAGPELWVRVER